MGALRLDAWSTLRAPLALGWRPEAHMAPLASAHSARLVVAPTRGRRRRRIERASDAPAVRTEARCATIDTISVFRSPLSSHDARLPSVNIGIKNMSARGFLRRQSGSFIQHGWIDHRSILSKNSPGGGFSLLRPPFPHEVEYVFATGKKVIGDDAAMAPPPDCLRTHNRTAALRPQFEQAIKPPPKLLR